MGKKPKSKSEPASVPATPAAPATADAAGQQRQPEAENEQTKKKGFFASLLPEGGLLPWWVVLLISVYLLLKLGLFFEGPCGALGTHSPVTRGQISKAFRTLSTCTHPDKLISHSPAEIRQGELLFKRASDARDKLMAALRQEEGEGSALNACDTQLDTAIYQGILFLGGWLFETGATSILSSIFTFLWELCTFSYDISTTVSSALLLMTLLRTLQSLLSYIFVTGPVTAVLSMVTYSIIGPLPSLYRFVVLPPMRIYCFVLNDLMPFVSGQPISKSTTQPKQEENKAAAASTTDSKANSTDDGESEDEDTAPMPDLPPQASGSSGGTPGQATEVAANAEAKDTAVTAARAKLPSREDESPRRGLRHRKAADSKAAKQAEMQQQADEVFVSQEYMFGPPVGTLPLRRVIERKPLPDMRVSAAAHIQFELLLSTTKYVIPLAALIATGQAFNGLWSSMITAQVLHKLPSLRPEMQHLLILVIGAAHTLLCASKSQLNEAPAGLLQLQWTWSVHDVLAVANLVMMGAISASAARSGNEPTFCASFAAGLALRMIAAEVLPSAVTSSMVQLLRRFDLELVGVDEVSVRATGSVGSCGGGPLRSALGGYEVNGASIQLLSVMLKAFLLLMPLLATLQWWLRSGTLIKRLMREAQRQGKPKPLKSGELLIPVLRRRLAASLTMAISLSITVIFFALYELNGLNASLGNFFVAALAGCMFESLLATYDLQGRLRQFTFFIMFMLL